MTISLNRSGDLPVLGSLRQSARRHIDLWLPLALILLLCSSFVIRDHELLHHLFLGTVALPFLCTVTGTEGRSILRSRVAIAAVLYLAYFTVSAGWSAFPDRVLNNAFNALSNIAFLFVVVILQERNPRFAQLLLLSFVVTAGVVAPLTLILFYMDHDFPMDRAYGLGLGGYPTRAAMLYLVAILAALFVFIFPSRPLLQRLLAGLAIIGPTLFVLLAQARGVMVGLAVAVAAGALVHGGRRALWILAAPPSLLLLVGLLGLIDVQGLVDRGFTLRVMIWDLALERALTAPIIGHGFGEPQNFLLGGEMLIIHPHNMLLAHQLAGGVIGGALFCILLGLALWVGVRHTREGGNPLVLLLLVSVATCGLVEFDVFLQPFDIEWIFFWLPISLAVSYEVASTRSCGSSKRI